MEKYKNDKNIYEKMWTVMFPIEKNIFSENEMNKLEFLSDTLPLEHIEVGDADEPNFLEVGRMMTDVNNPEIVNDTISNEAISILTSTKAMNFFQFFLNKKNLFLRRLQYNILKKDCFVGLHLDTDSNPDYLVAVVLQFGGNFKGGEYVVYGGEEPPRSFHPPKYSMIISNCKFEHEVKKIQSGIRKSLVFFLSTNNGQNRRIK